MGLTWWGRLFLSWTHFGMEMVFPCSLICFYNWQLLYILYYTSCFLCTLQSLHEPKQLDNLTT